MRRFVQAFSGDPPSQLSPELAEALGSTTDRYNIAVRKPASVIVLEEGAPVLREFQWGLVPRWSKLPETPYTTVTARLDRAPSSRIYRQAWEERHCVIPLSGYYKWDRTTKPAAPRYIHASDGGALLVAGLWECWDKEPPGLCTFTVLTHANEAIPPPLSPDGPLFLSGGRWKAWLDADRWFPRQTLLRSAQPQLESYVVSRAVRDPERDDYTLLEPVLTEDPAGPLEVDEEWDEFD